MDLGDLEPHAAALAMHNPPRDVWFDERGAFHFRCITDKPNPDCAGCRETERPHGHYWRFTPGNITISQPSHLDHDPEQKPEYPNPDSSIPDRK